MFQIATIDTANIIGFANIPQTFQHLQLRVNSKGTFGGGEERWYLRLNGDSTAGAYNFGAFTGSIASGASTQQDFTTAYGILGFTASTGTTDAFGQLIITFFDYSDTTKFKTVVSYGGHSQLNNASGFSKSGILIQCWENLSGITSLSGGPESSFQNTSSSATLYGLGRSFNTGA